MNTKHHDLLVDNRLRRIENRLRKVELLLLKNLSRDKIIKREIMSMEREEKVIEKEQEKLEKEEKAILKEMIRVEKEEKWHVEVQYNCKSKVMDNNNVITCQKTGKLCDMENCPLWKK